jgi:hypothetical protein
VTLFADARRAPLLGVLAAALVALSVIPGSNADNWLLTPGRASTRASTVRPCVPRKNPDTDKYAQVGPGQSVTVKWSSGHQRIGYWVVIHGSDEEILRSPTFETMVDDYLDSPPAGTDPTKLNLHNTSKWKRYHGTRSKAAEAVADAMLGNGKSYSRVLPQTDPFYLDHPAARTNISKLYEFNADRIASDRRHQYNHTKYPWILAAGRYDHIEHLPGDYDALQWEIPRPLAKGTGHHIIHWRWQGYYDCVDVDAFDFQATPPVCE